MSGESRPDSIVEEGVFGWVVRSSASRSWLVELQFIALEGQGIWFMDWWVPGETVTVRTGKAVE